MLAVAFLLSCTSVERDNPYDSGGINYKKGKPSSSSVKPSSSSSVDYACSNVGGYSCDMSGYKTAKINGKVWIAENLNCDVEGSYCYNNKTEFCNRYGRLYDWCTAMAVCTNGWHLPSDEEWQELVDFAGGKFVAGKYLKAKDGWGNEGNGEDKFGFSALPGGLHQGGSGFINIGYDGFWWSSSVNLKEYTFACSLKMEDDHESALSDCGYYKRYLFSVRCVKDQLSEPKLSELMNFQNKAEK